MVGFVLYLRFSTSDQSASTTKTTSSILNKSSDSGSTPDRLRDLEEAVALLSQKSTIPKESEDLTSSETGSSIPDNLSARLKNLEDSVADLKKKVNSQSSSTSIQTSTPKAPTYIPLGWTGSSTATDWAGISTQEIVIDPADYPGYKNFQFEASIRIFQGNGKAFARVLNQTDGTALLSSEVTTTSQDYTWASSGTFTIASSKKTYRLQLKSLTGYESSIQNARLRINY